MGRFIEKFGLYTMHLKNVITASHPSKNRSTFEGKLKKLIDAKVLPRSALLIDVLAEAKIFSLLTQKQNIGIFKIFEAVASNFLKQLNQQKIVPHV